MVAKFKSAFGVPVGGIARFASALPIDLEVDGQKFIKNGYAVTSGFDATRLDIKKFDGVNWFQAAITEPPYTNRAVSVNGDTWLSATSAAAVNRSVDNGLTWSSVGIPGGSNPVEFVAGSRGLIFLAALSLAGHLARSTNNGASFTTINPGTSQQIYSADFSKSGGVALICGTNNTLRRSTDSGATFPTAIDSGFSGYNNTHIKCGKNDTWLMAGGINQISRSVDNGLTWSVLPTSFGGSSIQHIATDYNETWMVAAGGRLYRSLDDGLNWTQLTNVPLGAVNGIEGSIDGLFIASHHINLSYRTFDNGETWSLVDKPTDQVNNLTRLIKASDNGTWFLASTSPSSGCIISNRGVGVTRLTQHDYLRYL
ncbi:WD40/YVTN/BNR-like repeat-containing protein [Rheinheimera gaetbuli]